MYRFRRRAFGHFYYIRRPGDKTDYINRGWVAIVSRPGVAIDKANKAPSVKTFEQLRCRIMSKGSFIVLATTYRLGSESPNIAFF